MGRIGEKAFRIASVLVEDVEGGADEDFTITNDMNSSGIGEGDRVPSRIKIKRIIVAPTESTIWCARLFAEYHRETDPSEASYSQIYEDTWTDDTVASDAASYDSTEVPYVNIDDGKSIYGTIGVKEGATPSSFKIIIMYEG